MLHSVMTTVLPFAPAAKVRDDQQLAAACAAGDTQVFEEIYRRFGDRMKSIA